MRSSVCLLPLVCTAVVGSECETTMGAITYPDVARGDQTDVYHGTTVADPYRALEVKTPSTHTTFIIIIA